MFFSMISVFSVPVFFMISGVNLLTKEETVKKQIIRIVRCVLILCIFEVVYYLENQLKYGDGTLSIKQFFLNMYTSEANGFHLWYMYAYICFLMILPFLRAMVKNLTDRHYVYLVTIAFIFMEIIPGIEMLFGYSIIKYIVPTPMITNIVLFPILGHFYNKITNKQAKYLLITAFAGVVFAYCINIKCGYNSQLCSLAIATFVFLAFKMIFGKMTIAKVPYKIICILGKSTFGVYLIHIYFMHIYWWKYDYLKKYIKDPLVTGFVWILYVQLVCTVIVLVYLLVQYLIKKYMI